MRKSSRFALRPALLGLSMFCRLFTAEKELIKDHFLLFCLFFLRSLFCVLSSFLSPMITAVHKCAKRRFQFFLLFAVCNSLCHVSTLVQLNVRPKFASLSRRILRKCLKNCREADKLLCSASPSHVSCTATNTPIGPALCHIMFRNALALIVLPTLAFTALNWLVTVFLTISLDLPENFLICPLTIWKMDTISAALCLLSIGRSASFIYSTKTPYLVVKFAINFSSRSEPTFCKSRKLLRVVRPRYVSLPQHYDAEKYPCLFTDLKIKVVIAKARVRPYIVIKPPKPPDLGPKNTDNL